MTLPIAKFDIAQETSEITQWLRGQRALRGASHALKKIPGDASTRRYYRASSRRDSYIVMRTEPFIKEGAKLDFLVVQKHLASSQVDVPEVLAVDARKGLILLEDLGDVTLLRHLQGVSSPDIERHLYQRVIDSLVQLQYAASPSLKPAKIDAYKLRFDHTKLMWEVNFTMEHFYDKYLARTFKPAHRRLMLNGLSGICRTLAKQPTVLTHRDFHSRNIMVKDDRLVMIDFQDARLGPPQYDLASLLKDSYYQLEDMQVARLLDYYIARWEAVSGETVDRANFFRVFDLMSVQRNFKAIGSFASFLNRRGNATYLKYIGNTFENIRRTLLRHPEYSELREVLFHYYYF